MEDYDYLVHANNLVINDKIVREMSHEEMLITISRLWIDSYVKQMQLTGREEFIPEQWRKL